MKKTFETVCGSPPMMRGTEPWKWLSPLQDQAKEQLACFAQEHKHLPKSWQKKAQDLNMVVCISPPSLRCVHQILPDGEEGTSIFYTPKSPFPFTSVWGHEPSSSCLPQKSLTLSSYLLVVTNEPFCNLFLSVPPNRLRRQGIHPGHAKCIFWCTVR